MAILRKKKLKAQYLTIPKNVYLFEKIKTNKFTCISMNTAFVNKLIHFYILYLLVHIYLQWVQYFLLRHIKPTLLPMDLLVVFTYIHIYVYCIFIVL